VERLFEPSHPFDGVSVYAQTKRAMVELSEQLSSVLVEQGISVHCMHPGWADTPGVESSIPLFWKITKPILRTPEAGADTIVWLSVCDTAHQQSGRFWFDRKARKTHLLPGTKTLAPMKRALWERVHQWGQIDPSVWEKNACVR